jgi:hypothetical protein
LTDIQRKLEASGYRFQTLIHEVVQSLPFQARRGELSRKDPEGKAKEIAQR